MPTALSPIKSKRLDEKSTLQFLNGRLELYVLRVKEMEDAKIVAERELETIRQRMQADIDALRLRMSKELDETRKKLDVELDQKARLQVLEQEQHVELVKLRAQVKELSEIKALAESLQVELTKERSNSKASKETLSVQTTQLQSARRRIKDLERENRSYEASLSDATKELDDLRKKSSDFDLTRDLEITNIRKEMNQKHQEALAQWKKDTEERVLGVEKEVRLYFEGVVQGFKSQVEDLSVELDSTKKELDRTASDYEESLQVRQQLTEKVAHLEREYREERTKFKEDRKKYEATLEHFRSSKFAKEQEFNDLMDVKIALDAEITAYRRILDREETRFGLPTPTNTPNAKQTSRKRKSEASVTAAAATSKRVKRAPSSVQIVHLDLEKDRIVLENTSEKPVSLAGWEVRGRAENQVFRFPATYSMRPKSKMTVYSSKRNKNAKDERKPNEDSFLATKFSLNASGDFAVLLTADGVPVSTRAEGLSVEEVKTLEAEIKAELDDEAPPAEGCGIITIKKSMETLSSSNAPAPDTPAAATASFECQPGYALDRELLPELEAAIAFLQKEVAQIKLGEKDQCLEELMDSPPLPGDQFQTLLSIWRVPAIPVELVDLLKQLREAQRREKEEKELLESGDEGAEKTAGDGGKGVPEDERMGDEKDAEADKTQRSDGDKAGAGDATLSEGLKKKRGRKARMQPASDADTGEDEDMEEEAQQDESAEPVDEEEEGVAAVDDSEKDGAGEEKADVVVAQGDADESMEDPSTADESQEPTAAAATNEPSVEKTGRVAETSEAAEKKEETDTNESKTRQAEDEAAAEAALASLKSLRKSMLLDVLSKITSVAKSKGVDPAMFSARKAREGKADFMDLATISSDVHAGVISEWDVFAHQVYLFCQHVIADSEKRDQQDAKQKGVELLHFARTLTETLRKASAKKEESLLQQLSSSRAATTTAASSVSAAPTSNADRNEKTKAETNEKEKDSSQERAAAAAEAKMSPVQSYHNQASPKRGSLSEPLTPNRISARIRQRGNSDAAGSPQGHASAPRINEDAGEATAGTETRYRKRPRASSNASAGSSAAAATPPAATTASDDNMSESESQISASEAESKAQRRSRGSASSPASSAQTTPVKRVKTRKRRPVLPATRMSSRQQKRRAQKAAEAEDEEAKDGSDANNNDGEEDTAEGEDDDNKSEAAEPDAPAAPVLLTKSGRPRKKPGRKPAGWKKTDGK
ncbi:putative Laminlike protein, partial [Globisporangium splendens]